MNYRIRKAEPADVPGIAALLRALGWFAHMEREAPAQSEKRIGRHLALCRADDSHAVFVAVARSGAVLGYAAVHWLPYLSLSAPEGYVSELFVRREDRGRGIGTKLLGAVEEEACRRGCSRLALINFRHRESYQRGFYRKQGWEERTGAANFVYHLEASHEAR